MHGMVPVLVLAAVAGLLSLAPVRKLLIVLFGGICQHLAKLLHAHWLLRGEQDRFQNKFQVHLLNL